MADLPILESVTSVSSSLEKRKVRDLTCLVFIQAPKNLHDLHDFTTIPFYFFF